MDDRVLDPVMLVQAMARRAREAANALALTPTADKRRALTQMAAALRAAQPTILAANDRDVAIGGDRGLSAAMLDRLRLTPARVAAMADSIDAIAALADPVGTVIDAGVRPNGLQLSRVRVPIGVIGMIYESRPNVTADAAALCLAAGNAVILRGGSEAAASNRAIHAALAQGLAATDLPVDAIQLVPTADRAAVGALLAARGLIDLVIPRGGRGLVERVQDEARVPVLAHLEGNNHIFVDRSADPAMAAAIVVNAKLRRPAVCGAAETLLIDRGFARPERLVQALLAAGCEVRGDPDVAAIDPAVIPASAADWDTEYSDAVIAVRFVADLDEALVHIRRHGSAHTDAIVASDPATAERFLASVDSAIVLWNASTQFADGGEFGLGAEIGIATGRLHARGPVALEGLTTYKWIGRGNGQVRP